MSTRRPAGLVALLAADTVSALGNWVSVVVLPWLVLVNTGSPAKMGLVAVAELVPYLLSSVLAAPLADRFGLRRTSIGTDLGSALAMAAIAALPAIGYLPLLVLVGVTGALRGVGDRTKHVLLAPAARAAGMEIIRVTALYETLTRSAQVVGAPLGGLLIVWLGVHPAIWVDAASFAACAVLVGLFIRPETSRTGETTETSKTGETSETSEPGERPAVREPYLVALRGGAAFLMRDRVLLAMTAMIFLVNMLGQASTAVLIPLWVADVLRSPAALGLVLSAFATGAVLGGVAFTMLAPRLPRLLTFAVGLTIGGAPRLFALGTGSLALVLTVAFVAGVSMSAVNPILGAMLYERVPATLQTRVFGLYSAACLAGLPAGAVLAGWAVGGAGLRTTVLLGGVLYLVVSLVPLRGLLSTRHLGRTGVVDGPTEKKPYEPHLNMETERGS